MQHEITSISFLLNSGSHVYGIEKARCVVVQIAIRFKRKRKKNLVQARQIEWKEGLKERFWYLTCNCKNFVRITM